MWFVFANPLWEPVYSWGWLEFNAEDVSCDNFREQYVDTNRRQRSISLDPFFIQIIAAISRLSAFYRW